MREYKLSSLSFRNTILRNPLPREFSNEQNLIDTQPKKKEKKIYLAHSYVRYRALITRTILCPPVITDNFSTSVLRDRELMRYTGTESHSLIIITT